MKHIFLLAAIALLAGCASPASHRVSAPQSSMTAAAASSSGYEHDLIWEHADGSTAFLHLTPVPSQ